MRKEFCFFVIQWCPWALSFFSKYLVKLGSFFSILSLAYCYLYSLIHVKSPLSKILRCLRPFISLMSLKYEYPSMEYLSNENNYINQKFREQLGNILQRYSWSSMAYTNQGKLWHFGEHLGQFNLAQIIFESYNRNFINLVSYSGYWSFFGVLLNALFTPMNEWG